MFRLINYVLVGLPSVSCYTRAAREGDSRLHPGAVGRLAFHEETTMKRMFSGLLAVGVLQLMVGAAEAAIVDISFDQAVHAVSVAELNPDETVEDYDSNLLSPPINLVASAATIAGDSHATQTVNAYSWSPSDFTIDVSMASDAQSAASGTPPPGTSVGVSLFTMNFTLTSNATYTFSHSDAILIDSQTHTSVAEVHLTGPGPGDEVLEGTGSLTPGDYELYAQTIVGADNIPSLSVDAATSFSLSVTEAIPEPSTLILLAIGALGLLLHARRKRR
jgi:hypothetical protein